VVNLTRGKEPRCPLNRRLYGPQRGPGRYGEKKNLSSRYRYSKSGQPNTQPNHFTEQYSPMREEVPLVGHVLFGQCILCYDTQMFCDAGWFIVISDIVPKPK